MNKLLLSLVTISLLTIGGLLSFNKTDNTLITKGQWLNCSNNRGNNTCEQEESFLETQERFDYAVSQQFSCQLFEMATNKLKNNEVFNVSYFIACFYDPKMVSIAQSSSCFYEYYKQVYFTCART